MDFLIFKSFISTEALIFFYYMGAVTLPFGIWYFTSWFVKKFEIIQLIYETGKEKLWNILTPTQKTKYVLVFAILFLFMELFWRMLFEFLIAYMQIRDALYNVAG
ncbi:DUF4282 domain-containing protein [Sulfurimonas marina]|uniref:DUF4282 domain-containing protein n=1 Tax=Sulfurimonas marina TaxID=2590551 RepID=A0A7M1AXM8_9BACT|nr:DUF4282 domain-containing protein [Sulfurimonas marina]QOP42076.1 DUF4282 domain-containing protein [Sulfurimonas marina]